MHAKAKSYDWPFTVGDQRPKFPTQYTIPATGKDPFRMLIRDYVKMEADKDDRTHGFLDGVLRMGTAGEVQPRFMECMKLTLPDLTFAEFAAVAATGRLRHLAEGPVPASGRAGLDRAVPELQHRRPGRLHRQPERLRGDGVHQHPAGGGPADRCGQRRARDGHDLPVHPVRRGAAHGERIRVAHGRAAGREQRPGAQPGPGTSLLALAQGPGQPGRLAVGIRRHGPAVVLLRPVAAVGGRRLHRRLHRQAHRVRRPAAPAPGPGR